jgi:hypothetical protein
MFMSAKFTKAVKFGFAIILLIMLLEGCATRPSEVTYVEIPEGYLLACELPEAPQANAELSDAFAKAYKCGEQGNKDKERIRNLPRN